MLGIFSVVLMVFFFSYLPNLGFVYFIQFFLALSFLFSLMWGRNIRLVGINSLGWISLDSISLNLIILSIWGGLLIVMGRIYIFKKNINSNLFLYTVLRLIVVLIFRFCVRRIIHFYIFFELRLVPTFFLIIKWGYQPERVQASLYIVLYTACASLPLLGMLIYFKNMDFRIGMFYLCFYSNFSLNWIWGVFVIGAFFVKIPLYFFHLWLPKAHVEAPVAGSMVLAGVLLKLGSYGLIRIFMMWYKMLFFLSEFFVCVSLVGGVITALICIVQSDFKSLIAYSSIGHMGMLCAGVLSFSWFGFMGGVIIIVAHGLCSSGIFFMANVFYQNRKSRSVLINKGVLFSFPILCMFCFLIFSCNISAPPSINLAGELILRISVVSFSFLRIIPVCLMVFLAGCYSIYLYTLSSHGSIEVNFSRWVEVKDSDLVCCFLHFLPIWLIVVNIKIYV